MPNPPSALRARPLALALAAAAALAAAPSAAQTIYLRGDYLELPVTNTGRFITASSGAKYNRSGTGGAAGVDFWIWGTPVYNTAIAVGGANRVNGTGWATPPTVVDQSSGTLNRAQITGRPVAGLDYRRTVTFADGDQVISIHDTFTNVGASSLTRVALLDSTDPDPAQVFSTSNDVGTVEVANDVVSASTASYALAFGSTSPFRRLSVYSFNNTDPYAMIVRADDPNGTYADSAINLAMDIGTLAPGETKHVVWHMAFGTSTSDVAGKYGSRVATDVALTKADSADPVPYGGTFTYTLSARNAGPVTAHAVEVTDPLPLGASFVSVTSSTGTCSSGATVRCQFGDLRSGASATATITVRSRTGGVLSNTATSTRYERDTNGANDGATETTLVEGPRAADDGYETNEDTPLTVAAPGLLGNDVDPAGEALVASLEAAPASGTVVVNADGSFTYTPVADFGGLVAFAYRATNASGQAGIANVTINVKAVNDAPVPAAISRTTAEDTAVGVTLAATDAEGDAITYSVATPPANGTLSGTAPNLTYRPAADFNGTDTFTWKATDAKGAAATGTATITVTPANDAPVAQNQTVSTAEDTPVRVTLTGTDVDADALTFSIVNPPVRGSITGTAPDLVYTPPLDFTGTDSFTFRVNDGRASSNIGTVVLVVGATNDPPRANDATLATNEDTPLAVRLVATDRDGDALTYAIVGSPSNGTISGTAPNLTYTPGANFSGADAITFFATDGTSISNIATVRITVTPVNDVPVATAASVTTTEEAATAVTLAGSDADSDPLTFAVKSGPAKGTLSGTPPDLTYTPQADFFGTDSFTFTANDGAATSAAATVTIVVTPVNDQPSASADPVTTPEDTPVAVGLEGTDPDGDRLTFTISVAPANGTLSGTPPNLVYTPKANFSGSDTFSFRASDGVLSSQVTPVFVTVTPVNDAPVATAQAVSLAEDGTQPITLAGTDVDGDTLSFAIVAQPGNGTLSGSAPNVVYRPRADFNGSDVFTFRVSDGSATSAPAAVTITVTPANDPPTANAAALTTAEDTPISFTLTGRDGDGDALAYEVLDSPRSGTLTGTAPNLTYRPNADFNGSDSFRFRVRDGSSASPPAVVSITVTPVSDAPSATAQAVTTPEDTPVDVLLKGTDPEGEALTYEVTTPPTNGRLSGTGASLRYTPGPDYAGADLFLFRVKDAGGTPSAPATVTITVTPVNDAPAATAQAIETAEDSSVSIVLTARDPENDPISYALVDAPANGTLSGAPPNLVYRPRADFHGDDAFTFRAADAAGSSLPATVGIRVTPVNDAPVASAQSVSVDEDGQVTVVLAATDVDGDALTFELVDAPAKGVATASMPSVTYRPERDFTGADGFTFRARDASEASAAARVSVAVRPLNDAPELVAPTPSGRIEGREGDPMFFQVAARDVDGPSITYRATGAPAGAKLDAASGAFLWTPKYADVGTHKVTVGATDGTLSAERALELVVRFRDDDADGLPDTWERQKGLDPATPDTDGDDIGDLAEVGSLDAPIDTDADGTLDALDEDSDGDSRLDAEEAGDADLATAPVDTDRDGRPDFRDLDSDADGVSDDTDNCRAVANANQDDMDEDEVGDVCDDDRDGDGLANTEELALGLDPSSRDSDGDTIADGEERGTAPAAADTDADGTIDARDQDSDGDAFGDSREAGDADVFTPAIDTDDDGTPDFRDTDSDGDGVPDTQPDNCRLVRNADQLDTDGDGQGDPCDGDEDGDGVPDEVDNCRLVVNPDQGDPDGDLRGNACDDDDDGDALRDERDNCPVHANEDQKDTDDDGAGDACDLDDDGDGVDDETDTCPLLASEDQADIDQDGAGDVCDSDDDGDGADDGVDNCAMRPNADQADDDEDGVGDACDETPYAPRLVGGCASATEAGIFAFALLGLALVRRRRAR